MSRTTEPIRRTNRLPTIIQAHEDERLEYLAVLLLEIIDEELHGYEVGTCTQS